MRDLIARICAGLVPGRNNRRKVRSFIAFFNLKDYFYFKRQKFKVVSLGSMCFPRVIATNVKLKPRKLYGEKTCVFDLAAHLNIDKERELIETRFESFFDDISFSESENCWLNNNYAAVYNHDGAISKEEFIKTYKDRIDNFIKYANSNKFVLFVYSISFNAYVSSEQLEALYNCILKLRGDKPFAFAAINHNSQCTGIKLDKDNAVVLEKSYYNMEKWPDTIRKTPEGREFARQTGEELKEFLFKMLEA